MEADPDASQGVQLRGTRPERCADAKLGQLRVELEDRPSVRTRQRYRLSHDRVQHLVQVQRRADSFPDRAQRLQLIKTPRKGFFVRLQLVQKAGGAHGDCR
jgi:hypothetical protein